MTTDQKSHHYDRLMTREEVADYLHVSTKKVRRLEEEGMLPRIDLGRTAIRYRPDAVEQLLEKMTRKQAKYRLY
tara:strand:- start:211 stop:432 length:222 start_codon:yes stop_codon:yes gene_type:complete